MIFPHAVSSAAVTRKVSRPGGHFLGPATPLRIARLGRRGTTQPLPSNADRIRSPATSSATEQ